MTGSKVLLPSIADHGDIRGAVRELCESFPPAYFRKIDEERGYPVEFVNALTKAGWLAALIPEQYGGAGLGLTEASIIMEEINRSGANAGACHGQMYNMGTLLRHGSEQQKKTYLPRIANGELRLQAMAVTEPDAGTDTTKISTTAVRRGDRYVVNGQKVWISRVQHSDLMILLARTTPLAEVKKKSEGLSLFVVDLRDSAARGLAVRPILNAIALSKMTPPLPSPSNKGRIRVGLIDADIYSNTIPLMFNVVKERPQVVEIEGKQYMIPLIKYETHTINRILF